MLKSDSSVGSQAFKLKCFSCTAVVAAVWLQNNHLGDLWFSVFSLPVRGGAGGVQAAPVPEKSIPKEHADTDKERSS